MKDCTKLHLLSINTIKTKPSLRDDSNARLENIKRTMEYNGKNHWLPYKEWVFERERRGF